MNTQQTVNFYIVLSQKVEELKRLARTKCEDRYSYFIDSEKISAVFDRFEFWKLEMPYSTRVIDILRLLRLKPSFTKEDREYIITYSYVIERTQVLDGNSPKRQFSHSGWWARSEYDWDREKANWHQNSTLADLGIVNNEVVILEAVEVSRKSTGNIVLHYMSFPPTIKDFWGLVSNRLPDQMNHLHIVLLYTDSDKELAKFVRESYSDLHLLSGTLFKVYALERLSLGESLAETLAYWRALLSENLYVIWASLGWLRAKPYDKTQCYRIGQDLGILPNQFPCAVLFDKPCPERALIFPIVQPYILFFRELFTELKKVIGNDDNNSEDLSIEAMFDLAAVEDDVTTRGKGNSKLYERVEAKYIELRQSILRNSVTENRASNEYTFSGKTVFINNPKGSVSLNDFQNQ